ncbi:hypothetical protein KSE_58640 [Kitasatospora setae KM-6054]|uniref:Uncharacterized protein n=1 Tax=Kitasatospora setae (strain ATCC 33774 / DSM 43861 / JCM 3304 / KCC A-0304 / NBRC 14216 / KM-6054) TaxID=452652 RepID=E4N0F0_KITSK|nr:hypothetical protein KSE_58640 [Kitasatospora setae KM-6054]
MRWNPGRRGPVARHLREEKTDCPSGFRPRRWRRPWPVPPGEREGDVRDYLAAVLDMVGPGRPDRPESVEWGGLEGLLGIELPADFKEIAETYAPVTLNHHLTLTRPGTR